MFQVTHRYSGRADARGDKTADARGGNTADARGGDAADARRNNTAGARGDQRAGGAQVLAGGAEMDWRGNRAAKTPSTGSTLHRR